MRRAAASLDLGGGGQAVLFARKACNIPQGAPADFVRSALVASFTLAVSWQSPQLRQHIRRAGRMALGDTQDRERGEEGFSQPLSVLGFTPHATTAQPNGYLLDLATTRFEAALEECASVARFGDIAELEDSKRIPLNSRDREERKGPYPYYGATSIMDYVDDYLFNGIRVLLGEDGSVIDSEGKPVLQYVWGKYWVNNHAHIVKASGEYSLEAIYVALRRTSISHIVTGAVQMKISQRNLQKLELSMPNPESLDYLQPLFAAYRNLCEENNKLAALRDALLPKLMSGETDVSEVDLTQLNSHLA